MEIPPAGAPPGGGVRLCGNDLWVRLIFCGWCRFAQDDTVGDWGAVPYMFGANVSTVRPPSSGEYTCATQPPTPVFEPSEAKGKISRHHPNPRLESPSGKVPRIPKLHRKGHPKRTTYRNVHTSRVPFAVKFLEFLEPSPKEGSKRGLGRRPKVFPSLTPSSRAGWCGRGRGRTPSEGCGACRARRAPATRRHPRVRRQ